MSRLLTGSCSFWWSCVRGSASRSERLFVSNLSWRKSCWCFWNQTFPHYFSPVTNKLLNWESIYTPLPGSHVCVVLTRPRHLSPVLTHGDRLDPQCVVCRLTPELQHTAAGHNPRGEAWVDNVPLYVNTRTTVSKYKHHPSWGEQSNKISCINFI